MPPVWSRDNPTPRPGEMLSPARGPRRGQPYCIGTSALTSFLWSKERVTTSGLRMAVRSSMPQEVLQLAVSVGVTKELPRLS